MSSERPAQKLPIDEVAERAARVKAMLARWTAEDTSAEPDWDVEDIQPMRLERGARPEARVLESGHVRGQ